VGEPIDEGEQPGGGGDCTRQVQMGPIGGSAIGQEDGGTGDGDGADRQVHEQGPAPRGVGGEDPSEQKANGTAASGDGAVDAKGPPAFGGVGERRGQHGQGGRGQQGAK